ncbi:hypothetical protein Nepgr_011766 [Nepenthes gracilis]|uniref:Protein BIC1 n=1 Tax=Nepenthes gracilis TaxID=150966 RepID=A0AAD3SFP0_NEPGR|nr:hypothetical protein Nepgr_011766 [Nepenthes gracilis]
MQNQKFDASSRHSQQPPTELRNFVGPDSSIITTDHQRNGSKIESQGEISYALGPAVSSNGGLKEERDSGRERLKRYRVEVDVEVKIPEIWGQEDFLRDWIDCSPFDANLVPKGVTSARAALVEEGTRANSRRLRVQNSC